MPRRVFVVGVGMTPFTKPPKSPSEGQQYPDLAAKAVSRALADCKLDIKDVQQAFVGNMFANGAGQRSLYAMGFEHIPIHNVHNACATGSNALYLARQAVAYGMNDCALALGVEKMKPGSLGGDLGDKGGPTSLDLHFPVLVEKFGVEPVPPMPQFFGNAGREHMELYGTTPRQFALIGEKNHRHSANNPYAQFRKVYTLEQIEKSPMVHFPLTKLQCSPTSDGAAAAIVCSEDFVRRHGLEGQAVEIAGMCMETDDLRAFDTKTHGRSVINMVGFHMAVRASRAALKEAGVGPQDVQVVELHDCFSCNELITYEALGLCGEGEGGKLVERGDCTYGGKYVINPSGGLISKGHPLGATGLAQCAELCWQMRGEAGPRQVPNARVGLQHNLGLGGACVVTVYKKVADGWAAGKAPKRDMSGAMGFPEDNVQEGRRSRL
uniref:propanoyl-CoA C-acyltransferase n=2 Tax=Chromera velia TaxID=505693 RepID=A0A2K8DNE6_9ALVE|nr:Sterol carrier protein 2 [Chromera velia]|eukprot:Cvel_23908.t1-p1 / transcript=Cvel_23908.t1 / gene=Cvel_23908 / organism=Chromera_velia_CCMP2878 / gene_product=Non-specific lipid-transfer protein, putative / transcript_product=Non-specific lipid-transfer protein, putative / location=Cvel_scaffold2521:23842-26871(+) / protein_length=436 / sequence_SO=supercontig / SO=protein_coding / is_pseudo=false